MKNNNSEVERLFRVRKTVVEMMVDRKYIVGRREIEETLDDFRREYVSRETNEVNRISMAMTLRRQTDRADQLLILFEKGPLGKKDIKTVTDRMADVKRCLLVVQERLTPSARKQIIEMAPRLVIEYFPEEKLLVNITKHVLVPLHEPLTEAEAQEVLKRYRLSKEQLPRMLYGDPIARWFGMDRGQVVKITRPSETAGRYVTYRLVF